VNCVPIQSAVRRLHQGTHNWNSRCRLLLNYSEPFTRRGTLFPGPRLDVEMPVVGDFSSRCNMETWVAAERRAAAGIYLASDMESIMRPRKLIPLALLSAMLLGAPAVVEAAGGGGGGGAGGASGGAGGAAGSAAGGGTSGSTSSSTGTSTTGQGSQGVTGPYSTNPGVSIPPPQTNPVTGQQYDPNNPTDPNRPGSPMSPENKPNAPSSK
jgi:hypothetical protein